ncbi:MAG: hypothetical protein U0075_13570 [Thermomicrobiales bacterium]
MRDHRDLPSLRTAPIRDARSYTPAPANLYGPETASKDGSDLAPGQTGEAQLHNSTLARGEVIQQVTHRHLRFGRHDQILRRRVIGSDVVCSFQFDDHLAGHANHR